MLFFVGAAVGVTARAFRRRESMRRLGFATDHFRPHIREVDVVLRHVNGPPGGVDKQCRVTARLHGGGTVEVEEKNGSFLGAIRVAAKRLRRLLAKRIGGKRKRDGSRDGQVAYRRCWGVR